MCFGIGLVIFRKPFTLGAKDMHLQQLEVEAIFILREAVGEGRAPVMLFSAGKDSAVLLHLARKAFAPMAPPFPLLHVDTTWKFQQMYAFRDTVTKAAGMTLIVHQNPDAAAQGINPFDHGGLHTDMWKTEGLRQALDQGRYDMIFAGARRDEEKSRAKERVFSFRNAQHRWDAKAQRPEVWSLYNTRHEQGDSFRVFPLSNWTEMDIWTYILQENIMLPDLYFAQKRPTVERDGQIFMVDDDRFRLNAGEIVVDREIRFRTLGCYPLTAAVPSRAKTVTQVIAEMQGANMSERVGRMIDADPKASMEAKKQEGYF